MVNSINRAKSKVSSIGGAEADRLGAVRDLLFGEDMAAYQKQFSQLRDQIQSNTVLSERNLSQESALFQEKLDALEYSFKKSLDDLKKEIDSTCERLGQLDKKVEQDRNSLGALFSQTADVFQKNAS